MRISPKRSLLLAPVLALAIVSGPTASAAAEALIPWWHLASTSRPSYLQPGQARDELQRLTVSAAGSVADSGAGLNVGYGSLKAEDEGQTAWLEAGESATGVQSALEGMYGAGNVEVRGGPPSDVYEVQFVGRLADLPVERMSTGGGVEAQVLTRGRPDGLILVTATNLGDAKANPEMQPVTVVDELPEGLEAVGIGGSFDESVSLVEQPIQCALASLSCTYTGLGDEHTHALVPFQPLQMRIAVNLKKGAKSGEENAASITGGGAPPATVRRPIVVSSAPMPFGVDTFEMRAEEVGGGVDTQAGSHPFQFTTTIHFNEPFEGYFHAGKVDGLAKDLHFNLPAGLIGNPTAIPRCTLAQFLPEGSGCLPQTQLGVARVVVEVPGQLFGEAGVGGEISPIAEPLYNLEPAPGEAARFGFETYGTPVLLDARVRTGSDYGVTVDVDNITQTAGFLGSEVTFWGVPGDERHDDQRADCLREFLGNTGNCQQLGEVHPPPFLSLPTSCNGPMRASVEGDSWEQATESQAEHQPAALAPLAETDPAAMDGCNRLQFGAQINVTPDGQAASEPTGLNVDVHVPQEVNGTGSGFDSADVKNITVALPAGVALNPAAGDGLQACTTGEIGYEGLKELNPAYEPGVLTAQFTPEAPTCPNAAKIASVTIHSPLLPNAIEGFVYLASPQNFAPPLQENPFGSLVAMYIVAQDPVSGTLVKLAGKVSLTGSGQIVTTFENNPQLAFEDAELHFFGGERAPLASPAHCGTYTTNASFAPWSGNESAGSQSRFEVTSGPYGTPCPGAALPFAPTLSSGTTNINAGSFTPLTTTLSREDGQQSISAVTLHYPAGVSGLLAGVALCGEAQANAGTCGPESEIGETIVSVGLGGDPYTVTGGKVYITGPYDGAPFGLSIVNPASAGPFDLQQGRPIVVRAKIEVDPSTAALTITTDPPGSPYAIPRIVEGIPLQIKHVNVLINRPSFTFNPTDCDPKQVTGAIDSAEGASSPVADPFQVTNCAVLGFAPKFAVATSGKTSRADGASLSVKLSYPTAAFGSQANIARVKVELPKALPSRLTTLQKACTAAQFKANPAGCPSTSVVGHARAITPLVPVPLEGPAYFVSNGNESFPNLIVVLQGYGVTIDLVGDTFISKTGITSSTFKTVPDAPVGSFGLTLPEGRYSALAANGDLCKQKLSMPTEFVAQSGAVVKTSTKIATTGCPKAKRAAHKKQHMKDGKKGKRIAAAKHKHGRKKG